MSEDEKENFLEQELWIKENFNVSSQLNFFCHNVMIVKSLINFDIHSN